MSSITLYTKVYELTTPGKWGTIGVVYEVCDGSYLVDFVDGQGNIIQVKISELADSSTSVNKFYNNLQFNNPHRYNALMSKRSSSTTTDYYISTEGCIVSRAEYLRGGFDCYKKTHGPKLVYGTIATPPTAYPVVLTSSPPVHIMSAPGGYVIGIPRSSSSTVRYVSGGTFVASSPHGPWF